jgi:hypothetical protein
MALRLNFRNKMALVYGYLFPMIFLGAFWALYRHDRVPLALHMGELLTVTVLGGACLGMPTTMVGEREKGVWRRYRLAPVPTRNLMATVVATRYFLLVTITLLQLAVAMAAGMPAPRHPLELWVAFTFVSFAFIGLGLEIAMLADNVPAVQALGQCVFLPMLIIGGVAVQISSLPDWAQHVSAFFPGRYAVNALQACVTGRGLGTVRFDLLAMLLTGLAGGMAAVGMFRWDAKQRFAVRGGKGWLVVALAAWAVVGILAESRGIVALTTSSVRTVVDSSRTGREYFRPANAASPAGGAGVAGSSGVTHGGAAEAVSVAGTGRSARSGASVADNSRAGNALNALPEPHSWQEVTSRHIDQVMFERLPSDSEIVAPIARMDEDPDPSVVGDLEFIATELPQWGPGGVGDPVQKVRNYLYVAAVPDLLEMESMESFIPPLVFDRLKKDIPKDDLVRILYWVATHPMEGSDSASRELQILGLPNAPSRGAEIRERVVIYALKLLGRLTGKIEQK